MVRSFDQSGYYETRMLLMVVALIISVYFYIKKEDKNYLVIFISSALFFGIVELVLFLLGMRAEEYAITFFDVVIPSYISWLFQGFGEGSIYGVSGFLFMDMYLKKNDASEFKLRRNLFLITMLIVFSTSVLVSLLALNHPITSVRASFGLVTILYLVIITIISFILAIFSCGKGFLKLLGYYYVGTLLFIVIDLELMQFIGVRYIGIVQSNGTVTAAPLLYQVVIMLYSYGIEIIIPRAHYLVIPAALKLIKIERVPHLKEELTH